MTLYIDTSLLGMCTAQFKQNTSYFMQILENTLDDNKRDIRYGWQATKN